MVITQTRGPKDRWTLGHTVGSMTWDRGWKAVKARVTGQGDTQGTSLGSGEGRGLPPAPLPPSPAPDQSLSLHQACMRPGYMSAGASRAGNHIRTLASDGRNCPALENAWPSPAASASCQQPLLNTGRPGFLLWLQSTGPSAVLCVLSFLKLALLRFSLRQSASPMHGHDQQM